MKSTKCVQCGFVGWSDLENCKACGAPLNQRSGSVPPAGAYHSSGDQSEGQQKGVPVTYQSSGTRSFNIDETFVIRAADNYGGPSTKMDEPLESLFFSAALCVSLRPLR